MVRQEPHLDCVAASKTDEEVAAVLFGLPKGGPVARGVSPKPSAAKLCLQPANKVRFAWWGAEELGLVGSEAYVDGLSDEGLDDIAMNLNFDMIGSPNFVRFIYDGDGSTFGDRGPAVRLR